MEEGGDLVQGQVEEALEVGAEEELEVGLEGKLELESVGETLTAQSLPPTAQSLDTADPRPVTPMEAPGPRLTPMQASAMSRLTAPSGLPTAPSLAFVKTLLSLVQQDLVNKSLLCSDLTVTAV